MDDDEKTARLRYRRFRACSENRAVEITQIEKKERSEQPDLPVHSPQDSLFSSSSGFTNYRGILNLCIVLLALSNARVALENIIKYGILVDPLEVSRLFFMNPANWPSVLIALGINLFILISLGTEKLLSKHLLSESKGFAIIVLNLITLLCGPPLVVFFLDCHPVGSSISLAFVSITFLKLVSYHMINYRLREIRHGNLFGKRRRSSGGDGGHASLAAKTSNGIAKTLKLVKYPKNLTMRDMYYFMFAPTLCYEINFPRSNRVRKRFLTKRIIEMIFLLQLILALVQQWMVPAINNSLKPLQDMNISRMLERLLKLSVPNHFIWLIFFYWLFHSTLNAIAEITRFADRKFYNDWWNAETVNYFWANWNIPVHRWCLRHLYKPLLTYGVSKKRASIAVFFVSAFFHEYLVSVPLKMFRVWAFSGMLLQIPFAFFVNRFLHAQYGNMAVWLSLIIGQPLCILMYYHDYYVINLVKTT